MTIKLIALDLDGTLLNHRKEISKENKAAIKKAQAAGVKVVFDTGRPLVATRSYLEELGMTGEEDYCITFNGGRVENGQGYVIFEETLKFDEVKYLAGWGKKQDLPLDIISDSISYTIEHGRKSQVSFINNTLDFQPVKFDEIPQTAIFNKVVVSGEADLLDRALLELSAPMREKFEWFKTRDILLEAMPKGVVKATGLAALCEHLGIRQEEVLAMGDEGNDVALVKWAGLGLAPANAIEEVKAAANIVSNLTNDQNAVSAAIEEYVLHEN